ncbi:MAG: type II toxin-antitoxin system HicB family antitoxin [Geminicoccaceae bacterium]
MRPPTEAEGGGCLVEFPELPGDRETVEQAIVNGIDAMRAEGYPVPQPVRREAA